MDVGKYIESSLYHGSVVLYSLTGFVSWRGIKTIVRYRYRSGILVMGRLEAH